MPLFEFVCTECSQPFEELVRSSSAISEVNCPICGSKKIAKKISTFASKGTSSGSFSLGSSVSSSSCSTAGA